MKYLSAAILAASCTLSGCGSQRGAAIPTQSTGVLPQVDALSADRHFIDATTTPFTIHIGFNHGEHTDSVFGPVWNYAATATGHAQVFRLRHGSKIVFLNDDPTGTPHTGSGLGPSAFPSRFDNSSATRRAGTTVNGALTWSTGTLMHGQKSQILTLGPVGHYFFGCAFHYTTKPTTTNGSMGDVIVST